MLGLMQDRPLTTTAILEHGAKWHGSQELVTARPSAPSHRQSFAQTAARTSQLAHALRALGVREGRSIGIIALNSHRHVELWYAISGIGAIAHSINPRLSPDHLAHVVTDADDRILFIDPPFIPLVEALRPRLPADLRVVILATEGEIEQSPNGALIYESLLATKPPTFDWPALDENRANAICHTSGTTGLPKGVRYSHRSNVLHALAASFKDVLGIGATDVVLPLAPMFHANGWGMPYACLAHGSQLVLPHFQMDGASLLNLIQEERVTILLGVPTICLAILDEADRRGATLSTVETVAIAGSAAPPVMIERFAAHGAKVVHAWGMTETSPIGTANTDTRTTAAQSDSDRLIVRRAQGRPVFGVDLKIVGEDGAALPHDGAHDGRLMVRGNWVLQRYHGQTEDAVDADGWFDTGDIATIDADGFLRLTDRAKDLIKSGGEWVSSVDLEQAAQSHPDVGLAAAIGVPHPKWDERPLLVISPAPGAAPVAQEIIEHLTSRVARIWVPDDVIVLEELPLGGTGKVQKSALRERFKDYFANNAAATPS